MCILQTEGNRLLIYQRVDYRDVEAGFERPMKAICNQNSPRTGLKGQMLGSA